MAENYRSPYGIWWDENIQGKYGVSDSIRELMAMAFEGGRQSERKKPLESTPSVEEITYVINLLGLDERDVNYRKIATLAWTRAFKKASGK
jgi:hypothetical protein